MARGRKMMAKLDRLQEEYALTLMAALERTAAGELDLLFADPDLNPYRELVGREPEETHTLLKQGREITRLRHKLNLPEIGSPVYLFEQACRTWANPGPQTPGARKLATMMLSAIEAQVGSPRPPDA